MVDDIQCSCTVLVAGLNGTGHSSLVSVEKNVRNERKILNRVLINVGDGTQRLCQEHRVKLGSISTIVFTSLAPHNISGFPGVFLALSNLGVGELTVVGPTGLKTYLQFMTPFINRKYPSLNIREVETEGDNVEEIVLKYAKLVVKSVRAEMSPRVIGIACSLSPAPSSTVATPAHHSTSSSIVALPYAQYFSQTPTISELLASFTSSALNPSTPLILFCPLAVGSRMVVGAADGAGVGVGEVQAVCEEGKAVGIVFQNTLDASYTECVFSQETLTQLHTLYAPFFPAPLTATESPVGLPEVLASGRVFPALPCVVKVPWMVSRDESGLVQQHGAEDDDCTSNLSCALLSSSSSVTSRLSKARKSVALSCIRRETVVMRSFQDDLMPASLPSPNVFSLPPTPPPPPPLCLPPPPQLAVPADSSCSMDEKNRSAALSLMEKLGAKRKQPPAPSLPPLSLTLPISHSTLSSSSALPPSLSSHGEDGDDHERSAKIPRLLAPSLHVDVDSFSANSLLSEALPSPLSPTPPVIPVYRVPPPNPQADKLEVFFLGTGCATPSKHRANSGILLKCVGGDLPSHMIPSVAPPMLTQTVSLSRAVSSQASFPSSSNNPTVDRPTSAPKKRAALSLDLSFLDQDNQSTGLYSNPSPVLNSVGERSLHTLSASPQVETPTPSLGGQPEGMKGSLTHVPDQYVLLDCGESVASQLFYLVQGDIERFDKILCNLKLIWISHHHADHATGIPCLLQQVFAARWRQRQKSKQTTVSSSCELSQADDNGEILSDIDKGDLLDQGSTPELVSPAYSAIPFVSNHVKQTPPSFWNKYTVRQNSGSIGYELGKILIIASEPVLKYVDFATSIAGLDDLVSLYPITQTLYAGCTSDVRAATSGVISKLQSIAVQHCQSSFGVVLETVHKQKYVYSGDCRPSQSLVKSGYRCDVLIHEATFADDRVADANKKKHSTFSEAVAIAKRMQAKCAVLTHFSQRYQLSYVRTDSEQCSQSAAFPVASAYDYLHFSYPSQAAVLPEATASIAQALQAVESNPLLAEGEKDLDDSLVNENGINESVLYEAPGSSTSLNTMLPPWSRQSSDAVSSDNYDP